MCYTKQLAISEGFAVFDPFHPVGVESIIKDFRRQIIQLLQTTPKSVRLLETEKFVPIIFFAISRVPLLTVPGLRALAVLNQSADIRKNEILS